MGFVVYFIVIVAIGFIVAIGGIVGIGFIVGIGGGTCIPSVYRRRDARAPGNKAGGDACAPGHIAGDTPAYTGQALLILCSWVAHSLLHHYSFTTLSLLFHYSFTTPSLLLYYFFTFFYLLLLCSLVRLPINRDNTSDRTSLLCSFIHTKNAQTSVAYLQIEAFALPLRSNKQQEAYADMAT